MTDIVKGFAFVCIVAYALLCGSIIAGYLGANIVSAATSLLTLYAIRETKLTMYPSEAKS